MTSSGCAARRSVSFSRDGRGAADLPEPTLRLRQAPKPAASVAETQPPIATGRDSTLNRAVQQERIRGQDGLAPGGREE